MLAFVALALALVFTDALLGLRPALAQVGDRGARKALSPFLTFRQPPRKTRPAPAPATKDAQMLVKAREIQYDYTNERVAAVGNVQIYHNGSTLEADRVTYDQKTKRLLAEGNARLTEANGKITYGDTINLTDDFRDGFVDSLRLEAGDNTRLAATRADRTDGRYTVFQSGVYTACEPCKEDPRKPPLWQVRSGRIIHDEQEKMIYFEDARLEFFGVPLAYLPFFSTPDPTVKRKSGFLMPIITSSPKTGFGVEIPYYFALAPDYDFTFSPVITTRQGPLVQGEWRQRLINGAYNIRAAGIWQLDPKAFQGTPGDRGFRGNVDSAGRFNITDRWVWGWTGALFTDRTFATDYHIRGFLRQLDADGTGQSEAVSQLYLTGAGDRSYFDARTMYFYGFSVADQQRRIPVIHPVADYFYTVGHPVLGGELGYRANFTSLSRNQASFDPVSQTAFSTGLCASADPAVKIPANCLLRGIPGTYTRFSAETHWRRQFIDPFGQVFTPFASVRGDVSAVSLDRDPSVANYLATGDRVASHVMPTAGVEYRYPLINVQSWGTQTIEPIAQVIARPNETGIGRRPNEDAQSLVFDDGNLLRVDKFSGWDRVEGGGRANVALQYTAQFNRGGFASVLFGQSYHLFGRNSFAAGDTANTGLGSGLDKTSSDYVARVSYQPYSTLTFTTRYRFDEQSFALRRFEVEGRATFDRWNVLLLYGNYDAQPQLGFLNRREGVLGNTSYKVNNNWVLLGGARYNINSARFDQTQFGAGYVDDCLVLALNYITNYSYNGTTQNDHRVMLQFGLRTLGGTLVNQGLGNSTPF
ncbi:MAG: LPS-assembly protein LptD [Proteobacteria bacterium]|nr:LPS-assembly protein LptD [Pseudomonadota bacterium]